MPIIISKTVSTKMAYIKRAESFVKQYQKRYKCAPNPEQLTDFVLTKTTSVSAATWRQYKNSTIFFLESLDGDNSSNIEKLTVAKTDKNTLRPKKTSSLKKKHVSKNEENKLRGLLKDASKNDDGWGRTMYAYFETILSTGIRPIEVSQAKYVDDESVLIDLGHRQGSYSASFPCLVVENAKNSNGRTFGQYRYIDISRLNAKQHLLIRAALVMGQKMNTPNGTSQTYDAFYKKLRNAFYRFIQRYFDGSSKRLTLYSFRHQSIADLKYAGYSLPEIAAIVGHGSDATATEHYGKKRYGRARETLINANLVDVEKVRRIHTTNPHSIPSSKDISNLNSL